MAQDKELLTGATGNPAQAPAGGGNLSPGGSEASILTEKSVASGEQSGQGQGLVTPALHKQFPKELQGHPSLMPFDTAGKLANAYIESQKKMGSSVQVPGDEATEEERAQFLEKVGRYFGRPKAQDDYRFEGVEVPAGVNLEVVDGALSDYAKQAFALGLSQNQANELQKWMRRTTGQMASALVKRESQRFDSEVREAEKKLRDTWGGDYDKNKELANRAFTQFASPEFVEFCKKSGLAHHPGMREIFAKIGAATSEGTMPRGRGGQNNQPDMFPKLKEWEAQRTKSTGF